MSTSKTFFPLESEADLQARLCQRLALEGAEVLQFARVGARPRCPKCGTVVGRIPTQESGLPDIETIWPDQVYDSITQSDLPLHVWFEIKRPGGKATPSQLAMHDRLRRAGDAVYIVSSEDEMLAALRAEGIKLRSEER